MDEYRPPARPLSPSDLAKLYADVAKTHPDWAFRTLATTRLGFLKAEVDNGVTDSTLDDGESSP